MSIQSLIDEAQRELRNRFEQLQKSDGLKKEQYARFLTMQYHLTKGVQKHFLAIAANSDIGKTKKRLRTWLINFAQEEEFHFQIAANDLKNLGEPIGGCPLDIKLWWAHFDRMVQDRPFVRLGATCILENIADGAAEVIDALLKDTDYLNPQNLKFLTIHRHGPNLDHGNQILEALEDADLNEVEWTDVAEGAETATIFYLRLVHWVIHGKPLM